MLKDSFIESGSKKGTLGLSDYYASFLYLQVGDYVSEMYLLSC